MGSTFPITAFVLLLVVQGAGSLFLALLLGTLFAHRRQPKLLFWTLAWLCNGFSVLAAAFAEHSSGLEAPPFLWGSEPWLPGFAIVMGWWSAAFWLLGFVSFHRANFVPLAFPGQFSPLRPVLLLLLVTAAALLMAGNLKPMQARGVLEGTLAVILLGGTILAHRHWRQTRRLPALLLALGLGLYALDSIYLTCFCLGAGGNHYASSTVLYAWGAETILAVVLLLFLIDAEQRRLKETAGELGESRERFRLIFEHSGVGMTLLSRDGELLQVNPALAHMLGYHESELKQRRLAEFVHARDNSKEGIGSPYSVGDTPTFYEREKRYICKNGDSIWARVLRVPVRDAQGQTLYYVGVLIDITQRRLAEERLAESEKRYRLLNQAARDGIHITDDTGQFVDVNPAFCQTLGFEQDELLRLNLSDLAVDPEVVQRYRQTVLNRGGGRAETLLRRHDGSLVDVELSGALLDMDGKRLLHGICRDVSEQKRDKLKLQEERDFSRQVLETADVLIFVADSFGRLVHFNATCRSVLGYSEEAVRGKQFWDVLLPERHIALAREGHLQLTGAMGSGDAGPPMVHEMHWRTRGGEERLVSWRNSIVRDMHGQVRYVISAGQDVTEQRQFEEKLRQARKLESLGTLVGGIAHDFNNQLMVVLGNLTLVQEDVGALGGCRAGVLHEPLAQAEEAAKRCAEITQRLLTFSGGKPAPTSQIPLEQVLSELGQTLQRELPSSIQFELRSTSGLWPVAGDAALLRQVLINLALNARDAMPGGGTIAVTAVNRVLEERDCLISAEAHPGRFVELTVTDTGGGMSAEVLSRLFEPFFTTKEPGRAAGLGLAVAYGAVKAHKGWIAVQSEQGRGSTFRLYLPAMASVQDGRQGAAGPAKGGGECILAADDEELVLSLVEAILRRGGYEVLTAHDGAEAMDVYRANRQRISLVLLDYAMPKMNGLEVLHEMQRIDPCVCAVFSSGYTRDSDSGHLLASGARAFIPKPYHPEELLRVIRRILDREPATTPQIQSAGKP